MDHGVPACYRSYAPLCARSRLTAERGSTWLWRHSFHSFPSRDVLAFTPEDFGGVIIELMPPLLQNGLFNPAAPIAQVTKWQDRPIRLVKALGRARYGRSHFMVGRPGLLVPDPVQPSSGFYVPTRRAQTLKTRTDVDAFRKGRIPPSDLLPRCSPKRLFRSSAAATMTSLCFKPFKEIEVAVEFGKHEGSRLPRFRSGHALMRKAFHPETGPLADKSLAPPNARPRCTCSLQPSATRKIRQATGMWR